MKIFYYFFLLFLFSCSTYKKQINRFSNLDEIITQYLDENTDSILDREFVVEGNKLNLSIDDINIHLTEERIRGLDAFVISGTVVRVYDEKYQPDFFRFIDYKGEKIRVFYDLIENNKDTIYNFNYNKELDMLFYFSDHSKEWFVYKCKKENSFRINKSVNYEIKNNTYKIIIDKKICK